MLVITRMFIPSSLSFKNSRMSVFAAFVELTEIVSNPFVGRFGGRNRANEINVKALGKCN
jgi:hypothetical protein